MPVYHQMGHDSENLLREPNLQQFSGAILSPVNYDAVRISQQIASFADRPTFELIFDPQLYVPTSERGFLREWTYFPDDVDTADLDSDAWWDGLLTSLAEECASLGQIKVCSPAVLPRVYTDEFFSALLSAANGLQERLNPFGLSAIQTAVVGLAELAIEGRPLRIASILSQTSLDRLYLILMGTTEPRRELADVEEIKGAMRLISELSRSGIRVMTGYSSSDMLLWRHAGAADCATGKFFNLRRFTRSRFEEPTAGGGQLPYWFEESLLAFLRDSDRVRIQRAELLSDASTRNPFAQEILLRLAESPGEAWVAKSWRQYMWWFADAEARITTGQMAVPVALRSAEQIWQEIQDRILMEEPRNDGSWLRAWRRACIEFQS